MKNNSRKECFCSFFFFFLCVHFAVMNVRDCSFPPPTTIHKPEISQLINQGKKKKESQIWPVNIKI